MGAPWIWLWTNPPHTLSSYLPFLPQLCLPSLSSTCMHIVKQPLHPSHLFPSPHSTPFLSSNEDTYVPPPHTPCENSQPGSPNASLGRYKKVGVFFRNMSSPAEQKTSRGPLLAPSRFHSKEWVREWCLVGTNLPRKMQLNCRCKGCVLHAIKPEWKIGVRS